MYETWDRIGIRKRWFYFCRLLRRQAPSPSASFFERMQFLIQEDGLQTSSIYSSFNERYLEKFEFLRFSIPPKTLSEHLHLIRGDFSLFSFCLVYMFRWSNQNFTGLTSFSLDESRSFVVKYSTESIFHWTALKSKYSTTHNKVLQYPIKMDCNYNFRVR